MKTVFISYSSKDKEFAEKLASDLKNMGIGVWFDKWEIKIGDSIVEKINQGIKTNDYLAIVLSAASVNSNWVKKELNSGVFKEIERNSVFVLPVLYKKCEIPELLKEKKYANFLNNYEEGLKEILLTILPETFNNQENLHKQLANYHIKQAIEFENNNRIEDAISAYNKAIKLCPDYDEAYCHLGVLKANTNQLLEAKKFLEIAIEHNPDNQTALFNLGGISIGLKQFEVSIDCFTNLIDMGVENYFIFRQLGQAFIELKEFRKAIKPLRNAILIAPNIDEYALINYMLSVSYEYTEDYGCNLAHLEEFVQTMHKMGKDEIEMFTNLSDKFLTINFPEKATEYLYKAMSIDNQNQEVKKLSKKIDNFMNSLKSMGVRNLSNSTIDR